VFLVGLCILILLFIIYDKHMAGEFGEGGPGGDKDFKRPVKVEQAEVPAEAAIEAPTAEVAEGPEEWSSDVPEGGFLGTEDAKAQAKAEYPRGARRHIAELRAKELGGTIDREGQAELDYFREQAPEGTLPDGQKELMEKRREDRGKDASGEIGEF
jgi:hypothetical protein